MWHQGNEAVFLNLEYSSPKGVKQKNNKKHEILTFKPLLQEIELKNLTIRKLFLSSNIYTFTTVLAGNDTFLTENITLLGDYGS